ncbi:MAG: hypothetical protein ACO3ZG_02155 [Kiritimatiellia bacterium]
MSGEYQEICDRLIQQADAEALRVTLHAHQEMVKDGVSLDDVLQVLKQPLVLEN